MFLHKTRFGQYQPLAGYLEAFFPLETTNDTPRAEELNTAVIIELIRCAASLAIGPPTAAEPDKFGQLRLEAA